MKYETHAVMALRIEPADSPDDFPTPPWASRALLSHVLEASAMSSLTCLEPACGAGHMARPLEEVFSKVIASDAYPYGYGAVRDFLAEPYGPGTADWVITNPPFRLAEAFIDRSLGVARGGVAILARTQFVEGVGRFERLFRERPPAVFAPFTERVPMVRGRLDQSASTATSYAWFVWHKDQKRRVWHTKPIPPCRKQLERAGDYPTQLQSQSSGSGEDGTFSSSAVQAGQLSLF